jgi:integrase/recombinase XerD
MRVCEVAALARDKVLGPTGEVLEEWRLSSDQTKGDKGRVVFAIAKLKRELAAYFQAHPSKDPKASVLVSQKGRDKGFSANTLSQLIKTIYSEADTGSNEPFRPQRIYNHPRQWLCRD